MKLADFQKLLNTKPTVRNMAYKSKIFGGKSPCIPINEKNGFTLPNCTGYVWGIWLQCSGLDSTELDLCGGNAKNYYPHEDKYERSQNPQIGAVACWTDKDYGHIGIVEKVNEDNSIDVKMSAYGGDVYYTRHIEYPYSYTSVGVKRVFQGFILNPYIEFLKSIEEVALEVCDGKWGNEPLRSQLLTKAGYDKETIRKIQQRVNEIMAERKAFKIGDKVKIMASGNASSLGNGSKAYGLGWTRKVMNIYPNRPYPYQVGDGRFTTGFYKKEALKKV